jgi:hypothetical protein
MPDNKCFGNGTACANATAGANSLQAIGTVGAGNWQTFVVNNTTYTLVANYYNGSSYVINSYLYQWINNKYANKYFGSSLDYLANPTSPKMEGAASLQLNTSQPQADANTVGLWHLDETGGTGAYLKDSSLSNNHGTPTGTTVVDGWFGKARRFTGTTSDYISLGDLNNAIDGVNQFTYEAWINRKGKSSGSSYYDGIITKTSSDTNRSILCLSSTIAGEDDLYAGIGNSVNAYGYTTSNLINVGQWHHVAMVFDGTQSTNATRLKIYIDGIEQALTFVNTIPATTGINDEPVIIGKLTSYGFNGLIDEVRISNIARSAEELAQAYRAGRDFRFTRSINPVDLTNQAKLPFFIASDRLGTFLELTVGESAFANYEPDANTVGLWHLEEQSGTGAYIKDSSINSYNGTPTGTTFVQGKVGKGRNFNGSSDSINLGTTLNLNYPLTLSAWINRDGSGEAGDSGTLDTIVGKWTDGGSTSSWGLIIAENNDLPYLYVYNTALVGCTGNTILNDNQWHFIVGSYDGTSLKIYVDNILQNTCATTGNLVQNAQTAYIGRSDTSNGQFFGGMIDEVRIDNIIRTPEEIRQAYEVGRRTHPITIDFKAKLNSSNLISNSSDRSFNIDETAYGSVAKASHIFMGDKIIIKENYDGTDYLAQGEVNSVNVSTGALTVASWESYSTFPPAGYSVNATVFKWQKEYMDLTGIMQGTAASDSANQKDAVSRLTLRLTDGSQGANVWLDDIRYGGEYLSDPNVLVNNITSTTNRYFQFKALFTTNDTNVSPSLSSVSVEYQNNVDPSAPSTLQTVSATNPTKVTTLIPYFSAVHSADPDGDPAAFYQIQVNSSSNFAAGSMLWDSGQAMFATPVNIDSRSENIAYQGTGLSFNGATYYWRIKFFDNYGGASNWSSTAQFTLDTMPTAPTSLLTNQQNNPVSVVVPPNPYFSAVHNDINGDDYANYYYIQVSTDAGFNNLVWNSGKTAMSNTYPGYRSANITYAGTPIQKGTMYYWRIKFYEDYSGRLLESPWSTTAIFTTNSPPDIPTLSSPANGATSVSLKPTLQAIVTDPDSDRMHARITLCENEAMYKNCQIFDQDALGTQAIINGWSANDYASGETASYTLKHNLSVNTTYYWKLTSRDYTGSNSVSSPQAVPFSFTTSTEPYAPSSPLVEGMVNPAGPINTLTPAFTVTYTDPNNNSAAYYQLQINTSSDFSGTYLWDSGKVARVVVSGASTTITYPSSGTSGVAPLTFNGKTYYWRVRFWNNKEVKGSWLSSTGTNPILPLQFTMASLNPPIQCYVNKNNNNKLIISWNKNSNPPVVVYDLEKSINGGNFTTLITTPADVSSYTDNSVAENNTYQYRVRASDGTNTTSWCTTNPYSLYIGSFIFE